MKTTIIQYRRQLLLLVAVTFIAFIPKESNAQGMLSYLQDIESIEQIEEFNNEIPDRIELVVTLYNDWTSHYFDCFDCYFIIESSRYGYLSVSNSQYLGNRKGLVTVQYYKNTDNDIRYDFWTINCNMTYDLWVIQIKQPGGDPNSFVPGTIKCYKENADYGSLPGLIHSLTPASGGCGDIYYEWELNEGRGWMPILQEESSPTYQPARLNVTTRYRRAAKSCSSQNGNTPDPVPDPEGPIFSVASLTDAALTVYSNEVTITVPPAPCITAISASRTVIEPNESGYIRLYATLGSGTDCESSFAAAYLSARSSTYGVMNVSSSAEITYPKNTTYSDVHDLLTVRDERSGFQTTLSITLKSDVTTFLESIIAGDQVITSGSVADSILLISPGSNLCGTSLAKWQKSTDNGRTWLDIAGADGGKSYNPGAVTQTTRYRHYTYCGEQSMGGYSNEVLVVAKSSPSAAGLSPSLDENYILTYTPQQPYQDLSGKPILQLAPQIVYYDGLGRPMQDIQVHANPWHEDIVTPITYDAFGRQDKDYLPYSVHQGNARYQSASTTAQPAWYASHHPGDESFAYSHRRYEPSPLNRIIEEFLPGAGEYAQQGGATVKAAYGANTANEVWQHTLDGTKNGRYAAGTLYKEIFTSPDNRVTVRYTDLQGRLVEERQGATSGPEALTTSYVYDNHGRLRLVIPPLAQYMSGIEEKNRLMYHYTYDHRGRCIVKRLPDSDPIYMVYDQADRLVMSQDGNQRTRNEWTRYFYDRLGREVATAYANDTRTPDAIRSDFANTINHTEYQSSQPYGYALAGIPEAQVLTYAYYDYYNRVPTNEAALFQSHLNQYGHPVGQLTGQVVRRLDNPQGLAVPEETKTAYYYDENRRAVHERSFTENGGKDLRQNVYSFTGQLVSQNRQVNLTGSDHTTPERYAYEYDHRGRLTRLWHGVDGIPNRLIATYTYDELGRQNGKQLGNAIETVRSTYDIRSRLTGFGSSSFYQLQGYENKLPGERLWSNTIDSYFGGDIRAISWKHKGKGAQSEAYTYDSYGRLSNSSSIGGWRYDANGNMVEKPVYGMGGVDSYHFGNQLIWEDSHSIQYLYDSNGNMTSSFDVYSIGKPVIDNISYNRLNLPEQISHKGDRLDYGYLASGQKREKSMNGVTTRSYRGSMVYKNDGTPDHVVHPEGIAIHVGNQQWQWYYHLRDYLGNVRAVVREDGTVVQTTDYYPFGEAKDVLQNTNLNKYFYGGKELQDEKMGGYYGSLLNLYDFEARFYSYQQSRFMQPDPLREKYYSISPYAYCANNPIRFIDPDGREKIIAINPNRDDNNKAIYEGAQKEKDNDMIHIYAHGDATWIVLENENGERTEIKNVSDFENMLNERSEIWQNRKEGEPVIIALHACRTGRDNIDRNNAVAPSIASEISKGLEGTIVIAPEDRVVFNADGLGEVGPSRQKYADRNGSRGIGGFTEAGTWAIFQNGVRIKSNIPRDNKPQNIPNGAISSYKSMLKNKTK